MWKLVLLCGLLAGTSQFQLVRAQYHTFVQEGLGGALEQQSGLLENVNLGQFQEGLGGALEQTSGLLENVDLGQVQGGLAGALEQTSGLLENVNLGQFQEGLGGALEQTSGLVENVGLGQVQGGLGSLTQTLQTELNKLQQSSVWKGITSTVQGTKGLLGNVVSSIGALGAQLTGVRILDVKLEVNPHDNSMDLRFPIRANVNVALPVVGRLVNLEVALDLLTTVTVEDLKSEFPTLVKGKCRSDPASFKLVLFDGKAPALNRLVDSVLSLKQKIVSLVIEKAVCPLLHLVIDSQVGVIIKNILDQIHLGAQVGL